MADVSKVATDRASPGLVERAPRPSLSTEGDLLGLRLGESAAVQKTSMVQVGISIGLADTGRVTILDTTAPAPPGRLIMGKAQWA